MTRYQNLKEKDFFLGDRAYGTVRGINHVREQTADYVFRLKGQLVYPVYGGAREI